MASTSHRPEEDASTSCQFQLGSLPPCPDPPVPEPVPSLPMLPLAPSPPVLPPSLPVP
eukprot:CAMPEP_0181443716 /NCGR_PEP_ID=MMETSP1110-20121109/24696_1 /TAXON_ID=174948 /ORGANISM="Symbiodinium sp., Strain CCMP421" /LENGTH=57 /DNA_ID=CAMNT_0023567699 /DNA_START=137 /DNA_END=306 /DNA_ORIENTATION=+